jgi:uncharacterized protein YbjT (DUF2867 family)
MAMAKIAIIGATGTAGYRVAAKLKSPDVSVVEIARSHGVDLISGEGLAEALEGVDVAIDASNVIPPDDSADIEETLATAARNVLGACASQQVGQLALLTISGIDNPVFDDFPYCRATRAQEQILRSNGVPCTMVKSTQWHEFATNPAAVSFGDDEVVVQDWLIQPIAADTVADVLAVAATSAPGIPRTITGPEVVRLPELTTKLLRRQGDNRAVRVAPVPLAALADGALLAPDGAGVIGSDVDTWLQTAHHTNVHTKKGTS